MISEYARVIPLDQFLARLIFEIRRTAQSRYRRWRC